MRRSFPFVLVVTALALAGCTSTFEVQRDARSAVDSMPASAPVDPAEGTVLDDWRAGLQPWAPLAEFADPTWLTETADATGVPERALQAYAGAALQVGALDPECGIDWTTLAGIGYVESRHGTLQGAEIGADGRLTAPIFGPALDGTRFDAIEDHDGGVFDGDTTWDRAVGPMQIIPATWMAWGVDGGGGADPQNIDDAALTAAEYLCGTSSMTDNAGWRAAIAAYNSATSYADQVARAALEYAAAIEG